MRRLIATSIILATTIVASAVLSAPAHGITANESYVIAVYNDLVGYEPPIAEIGGTVESLDQGTLSRSSFVSNIMASSQFRDGYVDSVFNLYLDRDPTLPELSAARSALASANDYVESELIALSSSTYSSGSAGSDNGFVEALYRDLLRRTPSSTDSAYWVGQLAGGSSRRTVARNILRSSESSRRRVAGAPGASNCLSTELSTEQDLAAGSYCLFLDRRADPSGADYWTSVLSGSGQLPTIWKSFLVSSEFYGKAAVRFP